MNQLMIRVLGYSYSLAALPALAVIGCVYYRKHRSKGGAFFAIGAISTAAGSMFNQLFPLKLFFDESTYTLSSLASFLTSFALVVHVLGFITMVIGWGIITFSKEERSV